MANEKAFENFNLFNELQGSLQEAVAFKKGDKRKGRMVVREIPTPDYTGSDVHRIRQQLQLSQNGLAVALGVSKRTVEAWEAGRNIPSQTACRLIYLIEKDRSLINQLVSGLSL